MLWLFNQYGYERSVIPQHSVHHLKILHSVKDWSKFGFFRLGGLMTFDNSYTGEFPKRLYTSHSPFYALPHLLGYSMNAEKGFYSTVSVLVVLLAISMSLSLALLVPRVLPQAVLSSYPHGMASLLAVVLSVPGESIWGVGFNNFDCTPSFQVYIVGITFLAIANVKSLARLGFFFVLVVAPLLSARFGIVIVLSLLLVRFATWRSGFSGVSLPVREILRFRSLILVALLTFAHFLHQWLVKLWAGGQFSFSGGFRLARLGLSPGVDAIAQGDYDYQSIGQAFSFLWRQSEFIQVFSDFPPALDVEHFVFWVLGIGSAISLFWKLRERQCLVLLLLIMIPGMVMTTFLNQSAAEHPDYYNIFWHPALVIGWTYLLLVGLKRLPSRVLDLRPIAAALGVWLVFLWQARYFLVAYPFS